MIDKNKVYIANHLLGNFPLGQAFWRNAVLIPGVLVVLDTLFWLNVTGLPENMDLPLILYAVTMLVALWGILGALYSAIRHVAQGGRALWRNLAILALVLNTILLAMTPMMVFALIFGASLARGRS
jgi:hypothetical protein